MCLLLRRGSESCEGRSSTTMSTRKASVAAPAASSSGHGGGGARRSAIELDKMKYDLFQGIPKQAITTMTNTNGGEVYEGQVDGKNKRHGKGTLKWPNGNHYFGTWADSSMNGEGTFLYAVENDVYRGEFKDDKKHGKGRYEFSNGNFYEGSFAVDKRHGRGRYSWTCGDSYDGEWFEGHMQGRGTTIYSNGNRYDGDFIADRREGKGKLVCADGLSYEGLWLKNMRHGKGRLQFPNGDFYEGSWENDKKHGHGTDCFVNGNKFVGEYQDNVKHGKGTMTYANGDSYNGDWRGDKMDGEGRYVFSNGFVYDGQWASDVRHGKGRYTFPSGHIYIGEWKSDKRHGTGQLTLAPSGDVYRGTWVDGKMQGKFIVERHSDWRPQLPGPDGKLPTVVMYSGPMRRIYEGLWEQGVPSSDGTFLAYDGPNATEPTMSLSGSWDLSQATRKSDGTIETPTAEHWRAVALLTHLSTVGKKSGNLLSCIDNVFSGMCNRPLMDFYDAEVQSFMPNPSMQNERLLRLRKYAELTGKLEGSLEAISKAHPALFSASQSNASDHTAAQALHDQIAEAERQVVNAKSEVQALQSDGDAMETDTARLLQAAKDARTELDALGKQKEVMKSLKANLGKLESQVAASAKEIATLKSKRDVLKNETMLSAQAELEEQQRRDGADSSDAKDAKLADLTAAKNELVEREAALKAATKQANDASAKTRDIKQGLEAAIQKINAQIAVLSKQIVDAEKARAQKAKKGADAAKKKQDQEQSQLENATGEQSRLQKLLSDIMTAVGALKDANDSAGRAATTHDDGTSMSALDAEVHKWREENRTQTAVLHEADATVSRLQEELVAARKRQLDHHSKLESDAAARRAAELTALQGKLSKQTTANDIIRGEVDSLDKQIKGMTDQRDELKTELDVVLEARRKAFEAEAALSSPKRSGKSKDPTSPKTSKKGTSGRKVESHVSTCAAEGDPTNGGVVAGRLRRGTSMLLQQARGDDAAEAAAGGANNDADAIAELEKRLATINRQNDTDEVAIERLLRDKKSLEDDIKQLNEGLVSKSVQQAAGLFSSNHAANVSLDLNEAGKEAVRHQLIKARSKQSTLLKDQDRLHIQVNSVEQSLDEARRKHTEGSQQSIAAIIAGLRPEDWRLTYLVEQLDVKGRQIQELESQCSAIPHLEEQLQCLKETLSTLQQSNHMNASMSVSSRRPPPF